MIDFRALFKLWREVLGTPKDNALYAFERAYFSRAFGQLGPIARAKLEQQLVAVNRVQRINQGRMVNLYSIKAGKSRFPEELLLRGLSEDFEVFNVEIKNQEFGNSALFVKIFAVCGHIFELQYSENPRTFFNGDPRGDRFFIGAIEFLIDPVLLEKAAR